MSGSINWRFPPNNGGTIQGFNDSGIATFKGAELYNNLAREICQNSLDAKREDEDHVVVKFDLKSLPKQQFEAIYSFDDIIKECKDYWGLDELRFKSFIEEAEELLKKPTIDVLVISDTKTTGLTGAKENKKQTVWTALTKSCGVTNKTNSGSGGSYGIGKSAPFACSAFRTVFYNTYAVDGIRAFQGVSRLVTHIDKNGIETQGDGYYQNVDSWEPIFSSDSCDIRDQFPRDEYGTDVIILGFKTEGSWQETIQRAIIKNFFYAIHEGTLVVEIGGEIIDSGSLPTYINKFAAQEMEDLDLEKDICLVKEFYEAITSSDSNKYTTKIIEDDDLVLYLRKDENYSKKIIEMRSIGMMVRIRGRNILSRFAAVVVAKGTTLSKKLKDMEPPKHDEWDPKIIDDSRAKSKATEIRSEIIRWVNKTIVEECKAEYQDVIDPDGMSQFLPLELNDSKTKGASPVTVSPDGETEIKKVTKKTLKLRSVVSNSVNTRGDANEGQGSNKGTGGTTHNPGGTKNPGGEDKVHAEKETGKNSVENSPKVMYQRSFPITSNYEIYKTIIVLEEDNDKVHISAKAVGDDGKSESVKITEYTVSGIKKTNTGKSIGPIQMQANTKYEIFMKLEIKERLLINIIVN